MPNKQNNQLTNNNQFITNYIRNMRSLTLKVFGLLLITHGCWQSAAFSQSYAYANSGRTVDSTLPQKERLQPLSLTLKMLEDQYHVRFNYNSKVVKDKLVSVSSVTQAASIEEKLTELLQPLELNFERVGENSFVILKKASMQADILVKGTVKDSSGLGLPGVSVRLKGGKTGTTTDVNGNYQLSVPDGNSVLVFTYIGFETRSVEVNSRSVINITLVETKNTLNEVVVVGYGVQKKADITGSVAVVNTSDMKKVSSNDVGQLLQGRASGVTVNSDGQPGAFPQVRIRGIGTFNNSDPLYVIDGVPVSGVPRDFNPNDIESMQVLKDASAGAV